MFLTSLFVVMVVKEMVKMCLQTRGWFMKLNCSKFVD